MIHPVAAVTHPLPSDCLRDLDAINCYRVMDMGTKHSLVEIKHDEGYGENLVEYLNISLRGKDMIGIRVVDSQPSIEVLEKVRSKIGGLSNRGLRNYTLYGENEMRSRCFDVVNDMIKSLQDSSR